MMLVQSSTLFLSFDFDVELSLFLVFLLAAIDFSQSSQIGCKHTLVNP